MANFCLKCWNELNHTGLTSRHVVISWRKSLCEGCNLPRRVVVRYKKRGLELLKQNRES